MCHGMFAATFSDDRHLLPVGRRAGERAGDGAGGGHRRAGDDRDIDALDAVRGELARQRLVRRIGLGDDEQSRRVLVDAVDDAGPRDPADPRQPAGAVVEQRVDHRAVEVARRRMDDEPGRLVDDEQVVVLEDDRQRDVLRRGVGAVAAGHDDGQHVARGDLARRVACGARRVAPVTCPAPISALSRSRDSVGISAASARSMRHPAIAAGTTTPYAQSTSLPPSRSRCRDGNRNCNAPRWPTIVDHAAAALPDEACGIVVGTGDAIAAAVPAANVAADPARAFEIDPATLLRVHRAARGAGRDRRRLVSFAPQRQSAQPSPTDAARAVEDGRLWLIAAAGAVTAWRAEADGAVLGRFTPVPLIAA